MIEEFKDMLMTMVNQLPQIIIGVGVFALFIFLSIWIRKRARKRLIQEMDDPLLAKFLSRVIGTIIILGGLMMTLKILRLEGLAIGILSGWRGPAIRGSA